MRTPCTTRFTVPETFGLHDDVAVASYELCSRAPLGPLDAQRLLGCADAAERLGCLSELLNEQRLILMNRLDDR